MKRKRALAALIAALWPSLLGPEHEGWRGQNRRIWRRRLSHIALIAAITGIGAVAAAPPYQRHDAPYEPAGPNRPAQGGSAAGHGDDGQRTPRHSTTLRILHADAHGPSFVPPVDIRSIPVPETAEEHCLDATDAGHYRPDASWPRFSATTPASFIGAGFGSFGGGGGGSSSGPSQGDDAIAGDPGLQARPAGPAGPSTPDLPTRPLYVVDPEDGPHAPRNPQWPPTEGPRPAARLQPALSPVPEPQAWLMMIAGFAAIGAALRTRRGDSTRSTPAPTPNGPLGLALSRDRRRQQTRQRQAQP